MAKSVSMFVSIELIHSPESIYQYSNPKSVVRLSIAETLGVVFALRAHTIQPISDCYRGFYG